MSKYRVITWLLITTATIGAFFWGDSLRNKSLNVKERLYSGIWEGTGISTLAGYDLKTSITMIVDSHNSRVSITNELDGNSYSLDASVKMSYTMEQHLYGELVNRQVNGLDEFISNTGILIPRMPALLTAEAWRLDDEELFINALSSGEIIASFKLHKKHQL